MEDLPEGVVELARRLPDPKTLQRRCQGLAMLEAMLGEDEEERYFHYDSHWGPDEQLASMRNGSGDEWSVTFAAAGVWLRGFDHESRMSPWEHRHDLDWLAHVPTPLRPAASEPAFTGDDVPMVTVACWRLHTENAWHPVQLRSSVPENVDDGAEWLFAELDGDPETYLAHAREYYEVELRREDVEHVLSLQPLSDSLVRRINPDRRLEHLVDDIAEIGYPSQP